MFLSKAGYSAYKLGKNKEALELFNKAIKLAPGNSNNYYHRSNVYRQLLRYEKSLADLNEAIKIAPNNGNLYNNRALLKQSMQYPQDDFCKDFKKAIELGHPTAKVFAEKAGCDVGE